MHLYTLRVDGSHVPKAFKLIQQSVKLLTVTCTFSEPALGSAKEFSKRDIGELVVSMCSLCEEKGVGQPELSSSQKYIMCPGADAGCWCKVSNEEGFK